MVRVSRQPWIELQLQVNLGIELFPSREGPRSVSGSSSSSRPGLVLIYCSRSMQLIVSYDFNSITLIIQIRNSL